MDKSIWSIQWKHSSETNPSIDSCFLSKEEAVEAAAYIAIEHTFADFPYLTKVHYSFVEELVQAFENNQLLELVELWNNILQSSGESELLIRELKIDSVFLTATKSVDKIAQLKSKLEGIKTNK